MTLYIRSIFLNDYYYVCSKFRKRNSTSTTLWSQRKKELPPTPTPTPEYHPDSASIKNFPTPTPQLWFYQTSHLAVNILILRSIYPKIVKNYEKFILTNLNLYFLKVKCTTVVARGPWRITRKSYLKSLCIK